APVAPAPAPTILAPPIVVGRSVPAAPMVPEAVEAIARAQALPSIPAQTSETQTLLADVQLPRQRPQLAPKPKPAPAVRVQAMAPAAPRSITVNSPSFVTLGMSTGKTIHLAP